MTKNTTEVTLTEADRKALDVIDLKWPSYDDPFTCTELGDMLFTGTRKRQCYARPAGKVLKRLEAAGYVRSSTRPFGDGCRRRCCYRRSSKSAPE